MGKIKSFTKVMLLTIILSCMITVFNNRIVFATENNKVTEKVARMSGEEILGQEEVQNKLKGLYSYINTMKSDVELMNELDPVEYIKNFIENGDGKLSFKSVSRAVVSLLFREVKIVISLALSVIVIAIICSLLKNLQSAFSNEGISNIAFFACYALLIIILSKSFLISISLAREVIINISDFMSALLPVLVVLLGAAGGFTQAATMDPIIFGATFIVPRIYLNIIIPLILITFVLQFANNISTEYKIDNLCKLMKQIMMWIQGITLTVFIGLLTVRGITSSTIDAVTLKTAKFFIDNFVPVVGKAFSDSLSTFAGYSLIIKNAVSSIGLVVIILSMLYPIIKLALMAMVYKISGALIEPISDRRITASITAAGDALILVMSCVLSVSLMFFLLIGIMASAGKFIIGG